MMPPPIDRTDPTTAEIARRPIAPAPPSMEPDEHPGTSLPTGTSRLARGSQGSGLVEIPEVPLRDPESALIHNPVVPESRRFCTRCGAPVGRREDGRPGAMEGVCPNDGAPFSFRPKLRAGDLVGAQYEVVGYLPQGGLGWIYLAKDRRVGDDAVTRWVVLKGLLDPGDPSAAETAAAERRSLAAVEHPNIVKILNLAEEDSASYIVMEYVGGPSLREERRERWRERAGETDPFPASLACEYVVRVLPALAYLHDRGLAYCDLKPDNVIRTPSGLTLIDLGAVRRIGSEATVYGTEGYQAPEIADTGPTVASDLYTVARTLAVLCIDIDRPQGAPRLDLPAPAEEPLFREHDSLYRFLRKGTDPDPSARFGSADEMAEQLLGVIRELVADGTTRTSAPSRYFTADFRARPDAPDHRLLPRLRVRPEDDAAGYLATLPEGDPGAVIEQLSYAPARTIEVDLRRVRALIDLGSFEEASRELDALQTAHPRDWRVQWYRGIWALAGGDPHAAASPFFHVYEQLPGELAPKLALGVASEYAEDWIGAADRYVIVARTDPSFTTATFGLARSRAAIGDRAGAIESYDLVPDASIAYVDAQLSRCEALLDRSTGGDAEIDDVLEAGRTFDRLALRDIRGQRLRAEVLEAVLDLMLVGRLTPDPARAVAGCRLEETEVRFALEDSYRRLARAASRARERIDLIDRANLRRPRTWT